MGERVNPFITYTKLGCDYIYTDQVDTSRHLPVYLCQYTSGQYKGQTFVTTTPPREICRIIFLSLEKGKQL